MRTPYGLDVIEDCESCGLRGTGFFCALAPATLEAIQQVKYTAAYPKGAVLFVEGQHPRGVFFVCKGRVKLTLSATDGKTIILGIAEPGELLGLAATVTGSVCELTAETHDPCQINFVRRNDFLRLMREHNDFALRAAEHLSQNYSIACHEVRNLALSSSAAGKLARLLLEWSDKNGGVHPTARLKLTLTHEEIAEMIGTSRETVTRLFAEFKKKQLVQVNGSTLMIRSRSGLETLVGS